MFLSIGKAAAFIGVSISTLRRWEKERKLLPAIRTLGGHRRYDLSKLKSIFFGVNDQRMSAGYARVSSSDQRQDLARQKETLEQYLKKDDKPFIVIKDTGSGLKTNKPGLKKLLKLILQGKLSRLVLTHEDRLLRFGSNLIFEVCKHMGTEVQIIHQKKSQSFEEELAADVVCIMTVACARLYGKRSHENRKRAAA